MDKLEVREMTGQEKAAILGTITACGYSQVLFVLADDVWNRHKRPDVSSAIERAAGMAALVLGETRA